MFNLWTILFYVLSQPPYLYPIYPDLHILVELFSLLIAVLTKGFLEVCKNVMQKILDAHVVWCNSLLVYFQVLDSRWMITKHSFWVLTLSQRNVHLWWVVKFVNHQTHRPWFFFFFFFFFLIDRLENAKIEVLETVAFSGNALSNCFMRPSSMSWMGNIIFFMSISGSCKTLESPIPLYLMLFLSSAVPHVQKPCKLPLWRGGIFKLHFWAINEQLPFSRVVD